MTGATMVDEANKSGTPGIVRVDREVRPPVEWVTYNPLTATYDTPDGTAVAAELIDNVRCLADALHIANIRAKQRAALRAHLTPTVRQFREISRQFVTKRKS
jgi:hypothetical protein